MQMTFDPAYSLSHYQCSNVEGVCPLSCESAVSIQSTHQRDSDARLFNFLFCVPLVPFQDLNCFLVDNNGFILLSKDRNEVGCYLYIHKKSCLFI